MNILDKIIADKRKEVELKKAVISIGEMEKTKLFTRKAISLEEKLKNSSAGIIAEFKRSSPSKSQINPTANVSVVAKVMKPLAFLECRS